MLDIHYFKPSVHAGYRSRRHLGKLTILVVTWDFHQWISKSFTKELCQHLHFKHRKIEVKDE